jgi:hypothetical protein
MSIGKQIKNIHTRGYYSVIKRNDAQIHATIWMNIGSMLSGYNQTQKVVYYMIPFI